MMPFTISEPLIPTTPNTPLDARTVVSTESDIMKIQVPYEGMIVYCKANKKLYKITSLTTVKIGPITTTDKCAVGTYEEISAGGDVPSSGQITQVQADWNQTDTTAVDYIKNKPTLLKGDKGDKGDPGKDGNTPVRGTDYWTAEDIESMHEYIDSAINNKIPEIKNTIEEAIINGEY